MYHFLPLFTSLIINFLASDIIRFVLTLIILTCNEVLWELTANCFKVELRICTPGIKSFFQRARCRTLSQLHDPVLRLAKEFIKSRTERRRFSPQYLFPTNNLRAERNNLFLSFWSSRICSRKLIRKDLVCEPSLWVVLYNVDILAGERLVFQCKAPH